MGPGILRADRWSRYGKPNEVCRSKLLTWNRLRKSPSNQPQTSCWFRYVDVTFVACSYGEAALADFLTHLNQRASPRSVYHGERKEFPTGFSRRSGHLQGRWHKHWAGQYTVNPRTPTGTFKKLLTTTKATSMQSWRWRLLLYTGPVTPANHKCYTSRTSTPGLTPRSKWLHAAGNKESSAPRENHRCSIRNPRQYRTWKKVPIDLGESWGRTIPRPSTSIPIK